MNQTEDPPGRRPTAQTQALVEAAEALSPTRSLARIESTARGVIAGVSASAAVLTGFGVLGAAELLGSPELLIPAVLLSAVALALAASALIPTVRRTKTGNLLATHAFFEEQIRRRGCLTRSAAIALALSYILAIAPVLAFEPTRTLPHASLDFKPYGKGEEAVRVVADLGELDEGSSATLRVAAVVGQRREPLVTATQHQLDERGALEVSATVRRPKAGETIEADIVGREGEGKRTLRSRLTLTGAQRP